MIDVISKPADQIGLSDIEALITSQVPEGEQIEFKESLSEKGKSSDPWMEGKVRIGDRARNKVLEEAVAFANSHGGALLIGIKESGTKPPVATIAARSSHASSLFFTLEPLLGGVTA